MKIKENIIWYLILCLFFALSIYLALKSRRNFELSETVKKELMQYKSKTGEYYDRSRMKLDMDGAIIKSIVVLDSANVKMDIDNLVSTPKLIFRFSEGFCYPCIKATLGFIKQLGDEIGHDKILVISDHSNARTLKKFVINDSIISPCYRSDESFGFEIETREGPEKKPYLFILGNDLKIRFPFFAEENDELLSIYFERLKEFLLYEN
jgi:hypothetical protein